MKNIKHQKNLYNDVEDKVIKVLSEQRDQTARKYPLVFGLAVSFGLVATFYGFEGIINQIPFLNNNPWLVLASGVGILIATGTAYKKLN